MELPVYNATVEANDEFIYSISLVEFPAVEIGWQAYSKDKKLQFEVHNEEQHELFGVIMTCDTPIYRNDYGYEYFIKFDADTIKLMAEKMLSMGTQNNCDLEHNENYLNLGAVTMRECFIKNTAKGINPVGFENVPDGSLFGIYKVHDIDVWEKVKNGEITGFSLAGFFGMKEALSKVQTNEEQEVLDLINKIKNKLK